MRTLVLAPLLLCGVTILVSPAHAQMPNSRGVATGPVVNPSNVPKARQAPPPALPGSKAGDSEPAPPTNLDLPPTEALFDAVNRGDIVGARDAVNRGADLHGHNVLGMTPLELSVDLGRNDITFLLLSMRGGTEQPSSSAPAAAEAKPAGQPAKRTAPVQAAVAARNPAPAAQPVRHYAAGTDPGTPNPQAGFLGFGGK
jgi:hypothetical protein